MYMNVNTCALSIRSGLIDKVLVKSLKEGLSHRRNQNKSRKGLVFGAAYKDRAGLWGRRSSDSSLTPKESQLRFQLKFS